MMKYLFNKTLYLIPAVIIFLILFFSYDLPKGWINAGSDREKYEMGRSNERAPGNGFVNSIKSRTDSIAGYGARGQYFSASKYRGKRMRMTAYMKSKDISNMGGFWVTVNQPEKPDALKYDDMDDRPVRGTTDWRKYELVIDVPANASNIEFGAFMRGTGQLWFSDPEFETVSESVKLTEDTDRISYLNLPVSLGYDKWLDF